VNSFRAPRFITPGDALKSLMQTDPPLGSFASKSALNRPYAKGRTFAAVYFEMRP